MWSDFKFSAAGARNKLSRETHELRTLAQFKLRTFTYLINMVTIVVTLETKENEPKIHW